MARATAAGAAKSKPKAAPRSRKPAAKATEAAWPDDLKLASAAYSATAGGAALVKVACNSDGVVDAAIHGGRPDAAHTAAHQFARDKGDGWLGAVVRVTPGDGCQVTRLNENGAPAQPTLVERIPSERSE